MANPIPRAELVKLWLQAGGPAAWADRMANIAMRESRGVPTAENLKYPDHSIGLWQINQLAHKGRYGNDRQLMDPLANAKAAVAVFKAQGPTAWSTYNPAIDAKYFGNGSVPAPSTPRASGTRTRTIPGTDNSAARRDAIAQFVLNGGPDNQSALLGLATTLPGLKDTPSRTVKIKTAAAPSTPSSSAPASMGATGVVNFDGKPVAKWIAQALAYAKKNGWTGTVSSGYRSDAQQTAIYKSGVRPAALPRSMGGSGSNHEFTAFPGGAVDVTNAAQLAQVLQRSPFARKLVWAGAKDPVHFSHPHNGGY